MNDRPFPRTTTSRRAVRAIAAALIALPLAGNVAHGPGLARAASVPRAVSTTDPLAGTITYTETYAYEKSTSTGKEGEQDSTVATWTATGAQRSQADTSTEQSVAARVHLNANNHSYTSETTTTPISCGNGPFKNQTHISTWDRVEKDTQTITDAFISAHLDQQGNYMIMEESDPIVPLVPGATGAGPGQNGDGQEIVPLVPGQGDGQHGPGTQKDTWYDNIGENVCAPKPTTRTTTSEFEAYVPPIGQLTGSIDPAHPRELKGSRIHTETDDRGGVRTTTIQWDLTLGSERCAAPNTPSGAGWVARFPGSRSVSDLAPLFRSSVQGFLGALRAAGASVTVISTYRPPERQYLMYWSYQIAKLGRNPRYVPSFPGVAICWVHYSDDRVTEALTSRLGAMNMVGGYHIVYPPALFSKHTLRLAVDMAITWRGTLTVKDAAGHTVAIAGGSRTGMNPQLWAVGASYGVHKLASDPTYWSDDGR